MALTEINQNHIQESLDLTQSIINACGPRLAGTPECQKSADILKTKLEPYCDSVQIESFSVHPKSFLGFIKISVISYIISSILLFFRFVIFAALGYLFAVFIMASQFFFYWEIFDRFYHKKIGYNVVGKIDPKGEVKQQIILSGHHDSAYVFNFLVKAPKLYAVRVLSGFLILGLAILLSWYWGIYNIFTGQDPGYANIFRYAVFIAFIFVIPLYFFAGTKGTPGAGDNLIASAMVVKLAEIFGNAKKLNNNMLKNTRLILLSVDAEEAGLRGARAYAKAHKDELLQIPTYQFNMDSIYNVNQIKFFTTDINGTVKLSRELAVECQEIAKELNYSAKIVPMTFGGGGTDSAEFAKIGVKATTMIAMSTELVRDNLVYHTLEDKVEYIESEAVEASLKIAYRLVQKKDEKII
jgi:hypothetical protein